MFDAPITNFKLENEKELAIYKTGFINGLDIKDNFKYTIMRYEVGEVLEIIGKHLMPTKHKMTRAEAIECFKKHFPADVYPPSRVIDFYIEAGMLEIVEEEKLGVPVGFEFQYGQYEQLKRFVKDLDRQGFKIVRK